MKKNKNDVFCRKLNLLEAEVYVRFPVSTIDKKPVKRYCELQEEFTNDGIVERCVDVDYPITPESVKSYADSADYRKNPEVLNNAVPRSNLGDVSEVQKIMSKDMSALREMYGRMQEIVAKLSKENQVDKLSKENQVDKVDNDNSEVLNNG